MRAKIRKVERIEIDMTIVRIVGDGGLLTVKSSEIFDLSACCVYFSMFPALGVLVSSKNNGLKYFEKYDLVIKSQRFNEGVFVGMVKLPTYHNALKILRKRKIKTRHIYFAPFVLSKYRRVHAGKEVIIYRSEQAFHILYLKNTIPVFGTTYFSIEQVNEFLKEYFDDGDVHLSLLSNYNWDYTPPVEFKKKKSLAQEGIILNALS